MYQCAWITFQPTNIFKKGMRDNNCYVLCASGACCPEDILRVLVEGGGVQIQEVLGLDPSCCGPSQERDPDLGPSCLLEMALGLGRGRAEVSLPLGGQEWTSFRGTQGMCGSSKYPCGERWQQGISISLTRLVCLFLNPLKDFPLRLQEDV